MASLKRKAKVPRSTLKSASSRQSLRLHRFAGVAMGGGKSEKTALAIIEYYPAEKRLFLRALRDRVADEDRLEPRRDDERGKRRVSHDQVLFELLTKGEKGLEIIAFDAPLQLPKCIRCTLPCPGYERCDLPAIRWHWEMFRARQAVKRPTKIFTPYTERCAEVWISQELEEEFHPSHALGANAAPLAARLHYLARRLRAVKSKSKPELIEVFPKLSVWRIGSQLKLPKSQLRFHRHGQESDMARHQFLKALVESEQAFIYQQDVKLMVENPQVFDAFIAAYTAFLKHLGRTQPRPQGYPKDEIWIEFPA